MFEIGWTEMMVIAVVMIVIVGPKDLPKMLRAFGKTTAKLRSMAGDFQRQFNDALKEAELDDVKKSVDALRDLNPTSQIKKQLNPFEKAASDVRAGLDTLKPKPPEPASPVAHPAEPLKTGATDMPAATPAASVAETPAAPSSPAAPAVAAASAAVAGEPLAAAKPAKPRAPRKKADAASPAKPKAAPRKKKTESSAP